MLRTATAAFTASSALATLIAPGKWLTAYSSGSRTSGNQGRSSFERSSISNCPRVRGPRPLARAEGWPFPLWTQANGLGWHFRGTGVPGYDAPPATPEK
ncbi:MAG: hypothetical protein KJ072_05810 [Verrucomicrobia bacterium]|nr:hypothetical protein [Verrucomicrobiota bacterium]